MKKQLHNVLLQVSCIFVMAALLLLPGHVRAQSNSISGTVANLTNTPLPLATIMVKQSKASVVSDASGKFSINAVAGQTLVISSVGYETKEVAVQNESDLLITLSQLNATLDEVVVVGYGTQKKKDLTGSISSVNINDTKKYSTSDISQLL